MSVPSPRSPVMTQVPVCSFSQRKRRLQFASQNRCVGQAAEKRLYGVEDHTLGPDLVDRQAQSHKQSFEVIFSCFLYFFRLHMDVVERELLLRYHLIEIEAQRAHVLAQLFGRLLECHENAGLIEINGAAHEKFHREERLAATGCAADERWATSRQSATGHFVQPLDPVGALGSVGETAELGFNNFPSVRPHAHIRHRICGRL